MTLKNLDAVSADGTVQQIVHEIRFRLEGALDPESGVLHYQVGVGTNSTPLSIVPYKVFKPRVAEYHLLSGLQLPQGPLSLRVKAWNRAYDETTPVDLYLGVDSFSPECEPMSIDGNAPGRLLQWTTDASKIRASWTCVDAIPWQAKALRCQFAVGLFPQDDSVVPWADSLQNASHGVVVYPPEPLKNGFLYYASVRCVDQVNLEGKQSSGGLLVDIHPPKISAPVQLKRALSGQLAGLQAEWVNGVDPLVLTWAFLDSESGISSIRAQLQSTAAVELGGGANAGYATANNNFSIASLAYGLPSTPAIRRLEVNISNLFGAGIELPLEQNGTYFLHACATDHVGWSDCSPPYEFRVDRTPPFLLALADTQNGLPVPAISSILAGFETDWQFGENESTVFTSSWMPYMEVGGVITALDDAPLLNDGAEGVAVVAVLPRVSGARYYSCVDAVNTAGGVSDQYCTAGFTYDGSPPLAGRLSSYNGSLAVNVEASVCSAWSEFVDVDSGISNLTFQLFVKRPPSEGGDAPVPGTLISFSNGSAYSACFNTPPLEQGARYYSQITAFDGAIPPWSTKVKGNTFVVDRTPPVAGTAIIVAELPTNFNLQPSFPHNITGVKLVLSVDGFEDQESDVPALDVVIYADGVEVASGVLNPVDETFESPPLDLRNGTTVYATVVGRNGVGLASDVVSTETETLIFYRLHVHTPYFLDLSKPAGPLAKRQQPASPLTAARMGIGIEPAYDPYHRDREFQYEWELIPVNDTNATTLYQGYLVDPFQLHNQMSFEEINGAIGTRSRKVSASPTWPSCLGF